MTKETKIGLLTALAIALAIWGYKYIKGKNLLTTSRYYYVEYMDVAGLAPSSPVRVNGLPIGIVSNLFFKPENMNVIVAELDISNKEIAIPKSAIAKITADGIMGGKFIDLEITEHCQSGNCAQSGDYIKGQTVGFLEAMTGFGQKDLKGTMGELKTVGNDLLDSLQSPQSEIGKTIRDFHVILLNLKNTTANLDRLMASSSGKLNGTLNNINQMTSALNNQSANIESIIRSTKTVMQKTETLDLNPTIAKTNSTIDKAGTTITKLNTSLDSVTQTIASLQVFVAKLNDSNGTLNKFISQDSLHTNINNSLENIARLSKDIERFPYRYVPFKSKKKVEKIDKKLEEEGKRVRN